MLKGLHLTLMIGPVVAVPVSKDVLEALTEISITTTDTGSSAFQMSFNISNRSPLHTLFLLSGSSGIPIVRAIIMVTINATPHVIMDGIITNHEISPGSEPGHSLLSVTGEDLSVIMDKQEMSGLPYPALPPEGRVALMLAKYAFLGVIPKVIPSVMIDVPIPTSRIPSQQGTDLQYIRKLADDVGYVFYIDPGPAPGTSFGYWGPQIKVGKPQKALNINMDAHTNVESLSFNFNSNKNAIPTVYWYDEITKVALTIPIPPVHPFNPPLGVIPPIPTRLESVSDDLSKHSLPKAIMIGLAKSAEWGEAVTGSGELDVLRYGNILKARKLVGVRGAGPAYDGLYYVKSVKHRIKQGEYKQSFELSRNGLVSTLERIPV